MTPTRGLTRREFPLLAGAAWLAWRTVFAQQEGEMPWNQPARVGKVYLASPATIHWPKPTLDLKTEIAEIEKKLVEVERRNLHNARLLGGELVQNKEQISSCLSRMGDLDGLLVIPLSQPLGPLYELLDAVPEMPVLFFSRPYATHAWSALAGLQRKGRKLEVVASSSYGDLDPYMRAFRTVRHLSKSKVIVGDAQPERRQAVAKAYTEHFGTEFKFYSGTEFRDAFNAASEAEARRYAEEFARGALRVVEPSQREIVDALRFYLALAAILKRERANAITIDCFGTMAANTLPGYPCIAWSKFNDAGFYGVCEADLHSTMTQMLVTSYTGMPGFVSDPVFDTSRNEVIHAHCVAATRMRGLDQPPLPYLVRHHLETNEGAAVQVLMPAGEVVTVGRFDGPRRFMLSTAEATGAVDSDRGCRTQLRTRVRDAEQWLRNYASGLHRVVFYGNHVQAIRRMGRLMAFGVVEEF